MSVVFLSVLSLTLLSGFAQIILAIEFPPTPDHPNPNMQSVFEAVGFAWKAGVGAIFGLLGGKVS